jgi:hypothetical protein
MIPIVFIAGIWAAFSLRNTLELVAFYRSVFVLSVLRRHWRRPHWPTFVVLFVIGIVLGPAWRVGLRDYGRFMG